MFAVMEVNFTRGAYYVNDDSSKAVVTIIRGIAVAAKPLRFRLAFLELVDNETRDGGKCIEVHVTTRIRTPLNLFTLQLRTLGTLLVALHSFFRKNRNITYR